MNGPKNLLKKGKEDNTKIFARNQPITYIYGCNSHTYPDFNGLQNWRSLDADHERII